jgi:hypothetical protein
MAQGTSVQYANFLVRTNEMQHVNKVINKVSDLVAINAS